MWGVGCACRGGVLGLRWGGARRVDWAGLGWASRSAGASGRRLGRRAAALASQRALGPASASRKRLQTSGSTSLRAAPKAGGLAGGAGSGPGPDLGRSPSGRCAARRLGLVPDVRLLRGAELDENVYERRVRYGSDCDGVAGLASALLARGRGGRRGVATMLLLPPPRAGQGLLRRRARQSGRPTRGRISRRHNALAHSDATLGLGDGLLPPLGDGDAAAAPAGPDHVLCVYA